MSRRTDLALVNSGQWTRVARRRYWHISGAEVYYDNNRWGWVASNRPGLLWSSLAVAAYEVEHPNQ